MLTERVAQLARPVVSFMLGERWNNTLAGSVKDCKDLFANAKESVCIVAGELQHEVFDNDEILSILEAISTREEKPVSVEIIHGPNPDPQTKRIHALPNKTKGRVYIMQVSERPKAHFILVDNKRVRIERYHGIGEPERRAFTKMNTMFLHRILADKFDALKASSRKSVP